MSYCHPIWWASSALPQLCSLSVAWWILGTAYDAMTVLRSMNAGTLVCWHLQHNDAKIVCATHAFLTFKSGHSTHIHCKTWSNKRISQQVWWDKSAWRSESKDSSRVLPPVQRKMSSKKRVKSESTESLDQSTDKKQKTTEETSNGTLFDLGER